MTNPVRALAVISLIALALSTLCFAIGSQAPRWALGLDAFTATCLAYIVAKRLR